jgi:multisubunit Na+/H+ antiporter MnhG subunit
LTETQKTQQPDRPRRTLGSGVVLLALAIGFVSANYLTDMGSDGLMIAATILGTLGIAFILLAVIDYSAKKKG